MCAIPPRAPIVAVRYWRSTGMYSQAQERIHQYQKHAELLLSYRDDQGTLALRLAVHYPKSKGLCESCLLSIPAHGRIETSRRTASGETVSGRD
jgi:hypothetical protein